MVLAEKKQVYHWNRIEGPEIDSHKYSQLIFYKGSKSVQWNKKSFKQIELKKLNIHTHTHTHTQKYLDTEFTLFIKLNQNITGDFPSGTVVKNPPANAQVWEDPTFCGATKPMRHKH